MSTQRAASETKMDYRNPIISANFFSTKNIPQSKSGKQNKEEKHQKW